MSKKPSPSTPELNATVMASAGTGKTWLLVTRLVRLLLAGAKPDAILAITFTRKAAAEMHTRLAERLFALASLDGEELAERLREMGIPPDTATLDKARRLYEILLQNRQTVRTATFHAFCQEILLRFPLEADVPPGFELLDSSAEIASEAWAVMLAEAGQAPNSRLAQALEHLLGYCGGLFGLQRALESFLGHRGDWWAYTEESANPVEFALNQLQRHLDIDPGQDPLMEFFSEQRMHNLSEFAELLRRHPNKGNDNALEAIATARHAERRLLHRFDACKEAFLTKQNTPRVRKASKAQAQKMGAEGEERFLELHESMSQSLLRTLDMLAAHETWHACAAWYLAGTELLKHYQRIKTEQRLLDFTDLEWRAYRLLNQSDNAMWVQYKLDQRIDHLLVDEFQDTNPTQWHLLLPLLQEMAASEDEKRRSVFLVGDAKQSIYRFRRAEPRLFQAAHEWLTEHLDAQGFPLHISWRSAPSIMMCLNRVFGSDGPMAGALRDYTAHDTHHRTLWGNVTVLPLIAENEAEEPVQDEVAVLRNPLERPREVEVDDRYAREASQISGVIQQLVAERTPIGSANQARPLHYGDIMLLVRSRSHVGYYEQALRDAGIPYIGAERGTLLDSLEVSDMVALLELLITPYNNLSLATVLRSPLFGCDDADLQCLAQAGSGYWYQRLLDISPSLPAGSALQLAARHLEQWRALAGKIPIHDLLDRIFCEGNILARYHAAFPEHLRNRAEANLVRFLELALEIDSGRYPSLSHFLFRLGQLRENRDDAPDEAPVSGSNERVRILTIHASKGLEAPVVFLVDSAASPGNDKPFRTQVVWPAGENKPQQFLLVGKQGQQPPLIRECLEREKTEEQREAANLLYVAMTRARQLLYVSGVKPRRGEELGWYGAIRSGLDPLKVIPMNDPVTLTSNTAPETVRATSSRPERPTVEIDPSLSNPLRLKPLRHEIAPSYHAAQSTLYGEGVDEDGRLRGLVIHRLLQRLTQTPVEQRNRLLVDVASEFALSAGAENYLAWYSECLSLIDNNALSAIFDPSAGEEALNEIPVIYRHNGSTVHGIIDRLVIFPDEAWIVDYKSHLYVTEKTAPELASGFRQQLGYYAEGIRQLWPEKQVKCFLLFTPIHLLLEVEAVDPATVNDKFLFTPAGGSPCNE